MDNTSESPSTLELFRRQCARENIFRERPIECDSPSCPSRGKTCRFYTPACTCSGCSGPKYCSFQCQDAAWATHKTVCTVPSSASKAGVHIHALEKGPREQSETEYDAQTVSKSNTRPGAALPQKVGHAKLQIIEIWKTREYGFFDCLNEYSQQLGQMALHFDVIGRLKPNRGCWQPEDFDGQPYLVYLEELVVDLPWRGKGIGSAILPMLFQLSELNGAGFILTFPTVLNRLEPPSVNGPFGDLTPEEEDTWLAKRDRIIEFYRKSGFRRLANSDFFCLAEDASHPSRSIPIDGDAKFEELPPPTTQEERIRRHMAYN
ncbi:hypothetical protein FB45DRAFT_891078 [Roridomyces roridus]|uniref:MYND-type domain-containing protein n=1 Tax=Roridomyces roridus TaxID=1738132 RepID=A0AAD7CEE3_9AGAR|nr:hypothetical protein FB45DRAFT_891078 [Roridomyces roridus]